MSWQDEYRRKLVRPEEAGTVTGQVGPHGTILYNSTALPAGFPVIQAPVFCVPAAEIADGLGTTKAANMVLLGALLELTHALPKETSFVVLKSKMRNVKLLEVDCCAIDAGMECVRKQLNAAGSGLYSREEALVPCK